MFERYNPESKEKSRKLHMVSEALKRFVLVGTLLLGSEMGLHPNEFQEVKNYSLAESIEMASDEKRELLLKMTRGLVKKPVSIESSIPSKEKDITISEIRKYLATLPKGWVRGEISSIETVVEEDGPGAVPSGFLAVFNGVSGKIFFDHDIAKTQERGFNIHSISHEIAHGNDFLTDGNINWNERYSLYKKLKDRLKSEDRFRTYYTVGLEEKFDKGKFGWIPLVREYWAEICAQYMSDPTQLHIGDFELVQEFVIKNDPNYKWKEKLGERAKIQGEFSSGSYIPKSKK